MVVEYSRFVLVISYCVSVRVSRGGIMSCRVRPVMFLRIWWYLYGSCFRSNSLCICEVMWACLSCLFMSVTKFLCRRHLSQAWLSVCLCRAVLNSLSRFLICLFSSLVTHGLSFCRMRIVFIGIACLAADRSVEVKFVVAVSMSVSSICRQSMFMRSLVNSLASSFS